MRIAHVLRKLDPSQWGGTETAIQRLLEGLRSQQVDSVVYCPRLENEAASDPLRAAGYRVERFQAFVPALGLSAERRRQLVSVGGNLLSFDLISGLRREKDLDLIHAHTLGRLGGIAMTVAKRRQLPFVVTIHGGVMDLPPQLKQSFNTPGRNGLDWGKCFGLLFNSRRLLQEADAIITCNPKEAELLTQSDPARRVVIQPHSVPWEAYQQDQRTAALAAFPQLRDRPFLLSLGRIDPVKNQDWLLDQAPALFQSHPALLLVLAGACTDEPYGRLMERHIDQLGLQNRVLLTGGLPPHDPRLVGLLQLSAALLLPSVSETFGLVILEAWAAGTVALASRTSGATALIQHGINGWLFDLDQPRSFRQAVERVLAAPGLARQMAQRGAEAARDQYSLRAVASRMKRLYAELVEERACTT